MPVASLCAVMSVASFNAPLPGQWWMDGLSRFNADQLEAAVARQSAAAERRQFPHKDAACSSVIVCAETCAFEVSECADPAFASAVAAHKYPLEAFHF